MSLPILAVVGRPNVGKSTLINRIATERATITHQMPGVTRDRKYVEVGWLDKDFILIDTGGFEFKKNQPLSSMVSDQARLAVQEADSIVFVVDTKEGLHPYDEEIASLLRKSGKKVYLAANKVDTKAKESLSAEFYRLGLGEPYSISASHGLGVTELFDKIAAELPSVKAQPDEKLSVAIVGRPNVGKSSLLNKLLGQERVVVSDIPGTTRDAIDSVITYKDSQWRFIDTAGIKKKKVQDVEYYGLVRTLEVLDRADIALVMIDASETITEQDQRILDYAASRGCGLVILFNKWDLIDKDQIKRLQKEAERKLHFVSFAPILDISVKTGAGVNRIFWQLTKVEKEYTKVIKTSVLNKFVRQLDLGGFPSKQKIRIDYGSQLSANPPKLLFFISPLAAATSAFKRFLEKQLRAAFGFYGTPVKILFKGKKK